MAAVSFDLEEFRQIYPQFAAIGDAQLENAFAVACLVVDNSERSPVPYNPPAVTTRKTVLYLLVCHLSTLEQRGGGTVGGLASASQGSVSASFKGIDSAGGEWFNQTQYGATAWQLLSGLIPGGRLYNGCFR